MSFLRIHIVIYFTLFWSLGHAQHRGDNLGFQGIGQFLSYRSGFGDGAYGTVNNDVNTMFINPAGLGSVKSFQVNIMYKTGTQLWRENQEYRPNRLFLTLPFYLEGLYIPDPSNNGIMDYDLALDSNYVVNPPVLGENKFSKESADWQRSARNNGSYDFTLAIPLVISSKNITVVAALSKKPFKDFDRNNTYLDPHMGYSQYNDLTRLEKNDTTNIKWYNFERERNGMADILTMGIGYDYSDNISVGFRFESLKASSEDSQFLDRIGYFQLADQNEFSFSYDTLLSTITGKSVFKATRFTMGLIIQREIISMGLSLTAPSTISRTWDYDYSISTQDTSSNYKPDLGEKTDNLNLPGQLTFSLGFEPRSSLSFFCDIDYSPFSKSDFDLYSTGYDTLNIQQADSSYYVPWSGYSHQKWVDRTIFSIGIEYKPFKLLSFMVGYKYQPELFVPDGQAFSDQGPVLQSYTMGFQINLNNYGSISVMTNNSSLKYYDSYFSNTNYAYGSAQNYFISYKIEL